MTEGIVDLLEVINIHHHQPQRFTLLSRLMQLMRQKFIHVTAVVQVGQRIADGLIAQGCLQRLHLLQLFAQPLIDRLQFLLALAALGGTGSKDTPSVTANAPSASAPASAPAPAAAPADDAKDAAAPAGASVRDGKFEFTVQSVTGGGKEIGDNPYLKQTAQGEYFVVTVKVTNIGDKAQSFSPSNQKLIDSQGREFEPDATAQIALGGSDIPVWDNINPGNTADVRLVYDMPVGAVPAAMELHDSMFSAGAKVNVSP